MQLTIGGKKYTFVYTVAATLDDDLLETVTGMVKNLNEEDGGGMSMAGKLPVMTKILFYGGLLQLHGEFGDGSVKNRKDAERLLFQYMTENDGKKDATLVEIFKALYEQMGEDNFLSRIGITSEESEEKPPKKNQKVTPIPTQEVGGEN